MATDYYIKYAHKDGNTAIEPTYGNERQSRRDFQHRCAGINYKIARVELWSRTGWQWTLIERKENANDSTGICPLCGRTTDDNQHVSRD